MRILFINNADKELQEWQDAARTVFCNDAFSAFDDPMLAIKDSVREKPDWVIASCAMRPIDGFCVLKMLRRKFPMLAVCLVGSTDADRLDAKNLTADGYIEAPLTAKKLIHMQEVSNM